MVAGGVNPSHGPRHDADPGRRRLDDLTLSIHCIHPLPTNPLVPTYSDKTPIIWDGNNAHIAGTLYEVGKFYKRTGLFQLLLKHRAVRRASQWPHSRSLNPTTPFVWFTSGKVADSLAGGKSSHDFDDPCRPTGSPTPAPQRPQPAPLCRASCAPSFFLSLTHPGVVGEAEALSSQCRRRCSKLVSRSDREPRFPS